MLANEGRIVLKANLARQQYAVTGTEVKVCVIFSSFDCLGNSWDESSGLVDSGFKKMPGVTAHRFAVDSNGQPISQQLLTFPNVDCNFVCALQWDQPFFAVSGTVGSANDLDIFVIFVNPFLVLKTIICPDLKCGSSSLQAADGICNSCYGNWTCIWSPQLI